MSIAGLSLEQRQALREKYLGAALAQAAKMGLTGRCKRVLDNLASPDHERCRGEEPGGAGCLCRCHDSVESNSNSESDTRREDQRLGFRS